MLAHKLCVRKGHKRYFSLLDTLLHCNPECNINGQRYSITFYHNVYEVSRSESELQFIVELVLDQRKHCH